jgi:hypothetical protein
MVRQKPATNAGFLLKGMGVAGFNKNLKQECEKAGKISEILWSSGQKPNIDLTSHNVYFATLLSCL